jgi:hypothetical protein
VRRFVAAPVLAQPTAAAFVSWTSSDSVPAPCSPPFQPNAPLRTMHSVIATALAPHIRLEAHQTTAAHLKRRIGDLGMDKRGGTVQEGDRKRLRKVHVCAAGSRVATSTVSHLTVFHRQWTAALACQQWRLPQCETRYPAAWRAEWVVEIVEIRNCDRSSFVAENVNRNNQEQPGTETARETATIPVAAAAVMVSSDQTHLQYPFLQHSDLGLNLGPHDCGNQPLNVRQLVFQLRTANLKRGTQLLL